MKRCKAVTTKGTRCKIQIESEIEFCHFHNGHVHEEKEEKAPEERVKEKVEASEAKPVEASEAKPVETSEAKPVETSEAKPEPVAEKKEPKREGNAQPAEDYLVPSILIGILVVFLIVFGLSFLKIF